MLPQVKINKKFISWFKVSGTELKICHFIGTKFWLFMVTLKYRLYKLDLDLLF